MQLADAAKKGQGERYLTAIGAASARCRAAKNITMMPITSALGLTPPYKSALRLYRRFARKPVRSETSMVCVKVGTSLVIRYRLS